MLVGAGQAGFGVIAATIIGDLYTVDERAKILTIYYVSATIGGYALDDVLMLSLTYEISERLGT